MKAHQLMDVTKQFCATLMMYLSTHKVFLVPNIISTIERFVGIECHPIQVSRFNSNVTRMF